VEVLQSQGMSNEEAVRKPDVASQTYYRWRKEYGDMETTQVRKLKDLEKENLRLKKLVADLSLDYVISKKVLSKSYQPGQAQRNSPWSPWSPWGSPLIVPRSLCRSRILLPALEAQEKAPPRKAFQNLFSLWILASYPCY
jgi:putative transposase